MQKTAFDSGTAKAFSDCPPLRYRGLTKTLLVMKLTIVFTVISFFQVHASNSLAQTVSISGKDLTLKQVFAAIEKQTDYVLLNTKGAFEGTKPVTLTVHKMPLKEFLDYVLKDEQLEYEIQGRTIMLLKKAVTVGVRTEKLELYPVKDHVTGLVLSEEGTPLNGVSVVLKKTKKGTITDAAGKFTIQAGTGDLLIVSYVGYTTEEVKVTGPAISVRLKLAHSILDETQITAYGKTTRRLATGNSTTIKASDIERQPVSNVLEVLVGRVPGVSVKPTSGNMAAPIEVVIRGRNSITSGANNDPLYVVDGLPLSGNNTSMFTIGQTTSMGPVQGGRVHTQGESPLYRINPMDIESVTILKDADATAIYGSRGANGVILITTKKGKAGPASFSVGINTGITSVQKYPKLLSTEEYLAVRREAFQNDGIVPNSDNAPDLVTWDQTRNKNWQKELVGTGIRNNMNASVSGGLGLTRYYLSAGYASETTLLNAGSKNKKFTFNSSLNHSSQNQKFSFGLINSIGFTNVTALAVPDPSSLPPNAPDIYKENGEFNWEPYRVFGNSIFPFHSLKKPSISKTYSLQSTLRLEYKILKGLTIGLNGSFGFTQNDNVMKIPEASFDPMLFVRSSAIYGKSSVPNWQIQSNIEYRTFIGRGSLQLQLVSEYLTSKTKGETIMAEIFPNDDMMKSYSNAESSRPIEGFVENRNLKVTGIINYNWDNKYIINITGTRDGSAHFGKGKRFGNFGSAGLAWNANEEKWIKAILPGWFNLLKLRGSFGITGSSNIPPYENISRWSKLLVGSIFETLLPYNGINAFHVIKPLNQDFHWVSTRKMELGVNLGLLNNKLSLAIDVYRHNAKGQLDFEPIPSFTGFNSVFTNTYSNLQNSGVEISMRAAMVSTSAWIFSMGFNIGWNRNKLVDFPNLESSIHKGRLKVGYSISSKFVLRYTGIDPLTGDYSFEDHNKDGKIFTDSYGFPLSAADDRYILIDMADKFNGGIDMNLSYKQLSLTCVFNFVKRLREDPYLRIVAGQMNNLALPREVLDNHWKQPGDKAKYPRFTTGSLRSTLSNSDAAYVNGSFFQLGNVSLSYTLPKSWTDKLKINGINVGINTSNLFTFSPYRGLDPLQNNLSSASPIPRLINTFLNINF